MTLTDCTKAHTYTHSAHIRPRFFIAPFIGCEPYARYETSIFQPIFVYIRSLSRPDYIEKSICGLIKGARLTHDAKAQKLVVGHAFCVTNSFVKNTHMDTYGQLVSNQLVIEKRYDDLDYK